MPSLHSSLPGHICGRIKGSSERGCFFSRLNLGMAPAFDSSLITPHKSKVKYQSSVLP